MRNNKLLRIAFSFTLVLALVAPSLLRLKPNRVQAGSFTQADLTISDSRAAASTVTYDFDLTATSSAAIKQIDIYYCTSPTGACTPPTGMNTGTPTLASDSIAGTGRTVSKISGGNNTTRVVITTPAAQTPTDFEMSFTGITNTSSINTSIYARITSYSDTGTTAIDDITIATAVLTAESIYVTADVGSTFTFSVNDADSGSVNGATIDVDSDDNAIPFGLMVVATPKVAAHDVTVVTNATNGYVVTTEALADPPLSDGSNNIDNFSGTNATPTTWSSPAGSTANTNTGFFGYTTEDGVLGTGTTGRFTASGGNKWSGFTTDPLELIYSAGAPGGSGETTRVGWQLEINSFQPPGSYAGSVLLIATPTY
jgi:hypothetical protein